METRFCAAASVPPIHPNRWKIFAGHLPPPKSYWEQPKRSDENKSSDNLLLKVKSLCNIDNKLSIARI
jgi:hypothetical protein